MSEVKYAYRIPPCSVYDVGAMEQWLESMAAKGLILEEDGFFMGFGTFRKEQPQTLRYRLEATPTRDGIFSEEAEPSEDARELNRLMGWRYCGRRGQFHIYVCADDSAPELHTDPRVQAISLQTLNKHLIKGICNAIIHFLIFYFLYYSRAMISAFLLLGTPAMVLFWALIIVGFIRRVWGLAQLFRLQKRLRGGVPPEHRPVSRQASLIRLSGISLRIITVILCVILALSHLAANFEAVPLDEYEGDFPFATLADLYPDAQVDQLNSILHSEVHEWSDWISPENYEYSEYADLTFSDGTSQTCYLKLEYFHTRWEWTARMLAWELPRQQGASPAEQLLDRLFGQEPTVLTELEIPGLDYCASYEEYRHSPYLILREGDITIRLHLSVLGEDVRSYTPEQLAATVAAHLNNHSSFLQNP